MPRWAQQILLAWMFLVAFGTPARLTHVNYSGRAQPDAVPAANRTFVNTYDDINRLTQEAITGNGATTTVYEYDDAHNRTSMAVSGTTTTYTYNSLNQLSAATTGASTVSYNLHRELYSISRR